MQAGVSQRICSSYTTSKIKISSSYRFMARSICVIFLIFFLTFFCLLRLVVLFVGALINFTVGDQTPPDSSKRNSMCPSMLLRLVELKCTGSMFDGVGSCSQPHWHCMASLCVFYVNFKLNSVFIILFAYICHPLPHLWTHGTKSRLVPSKFVFFFLKNGFKMKATLLNKHRLEGGLADVWLCAFGS
jgi:hypothetical protein